MDVVTGAMESLLPKLGELLVGEYRLQKGVKKDVESLEREMKSMHAALTKVAKVPRDQLDQQVKIWADEIRELSYDAEDVVDKFLVSIEGSNPTVNSSKLKGLMEKITSLFTKGKTRHLIANAIKDIKDRAQEVADLRDRCKVDDAVANAASINNTIDPRILALYKDQKDLVGIEDARDQLTERLTHDEGDTSNQPLQIVSIVGPGGLVLKDILLELELGNSMSDIATLDERQVINKLRDLLQDKRYFIIIDDIWDLKAWGIIKCALLDNNRGSRVITTTRILEVAANTGNVYKLEPLSPDLSEELFYTRLFGGKDKCPYRKRVSLRFIL
ncbi:hypothetical protein CFC21_021350 [Triticum aestivum]|uniref:Uncharacterized protein n=3 Tax=Triticum TaxID=4564 RepID=A0A9R1PE12_TRITD|nr:hypothetical protein CFC21_021350 [Triticum aestivum]VAH41357.1 unnamed protein product [Triticum turgidum subsp. durum]